MQAAKVVINSIISSARASSEPGMGMPSALAALMLALNADRTTPQDAWSAFRDFLDLARKHSAVGASGSKS
jgi:hypothetical protein